jgi:hypothetical protein
MEIAGSQGKRALKGSRGFGRVFESTRGRQLPHPFNVSLDVTPPESPLVSALESFQMAASRHVVHDVGAEIEKDRQVARLEDTLLALDVHGPLLMAAEPNLAQK